MTGYWQHPLFGDAILPPEWYLENTDPPATDVVEEPEGITEEPEKETEEPEVITEQPTAEAITATIVTQPAPTQPDETVTAAQQAASGTVQASTAPVMRVTMPNQSRLVSGSKISEVRGIHLLTTNWVGLSRYSSYSSSRRVSYSMYW